MFQRACAMDRAWLILCASRIVAVKRGNTMASAGKQMGVVSGNAAAKTLVYDSISRLYGWLEKNDYKAYDTFDGLSARFVRPLTFNSKLLNTVLQQGVRRFPLNLRPLLGVRKGHSTKGMGFLARGFMRLHTVTGEKLWADKAEFCLQWLIEHQSKGYNGAAWGNHFDYQSRAFSLPKGVPTVVWTSLIGHAFLDAYELYGNGSAPETAASAWEPLVRDLDTYPEGDALCISYIPTKNKQVHNANTLGASLLARVYLHTRTDFYRT